MGVNYSAVLYVGREFEDQDEAKDFYEKFIELTDEEADYIYEEGFVEFCDSLDNGLTGAILDCYSNSGFVFGFNIGRSIRKPETFAEEVQKAISKWKELFGEEKYEIIHTIRIW